MRINNLSNKIFKNQFVLNTLEKVSEHGISAAAGASLFMSTFVRPAAIYFTPDTEKENKQYAMANSICSGLIKFALLESVALPIENAIKRIDKNSKKYLSKETLKNLKTNAPVPNSRAYKFLTQTLKLGSGFLTAIPKSMLTIALIPIIMDKIILNRPFKEAEKNNPETKNGELNFTGSIGDRLSKQLAKIINNKKVQNYAVKFETKDSDIAKHITAATDLLLTTSFAYQTNKSKKIKENRKKALIYNNFIATAITIAGGYSIDKLIKTKSSKFIENFANMHKGNPKLPKYIEGLNIIRPMIIFGAIYYGILPIFSTYLGEKIDKYVEKHYNK